MPKKKPLQRTVGFDKVSALILKGLGGKSNLSDVDCCATRLRVTVMQPDLVQDSLLKESGASGVIHKGNGVQVIYGPQVSVVKSNLEDFLDTADAENVDALLNGNVSPEPVPGLDFIKSVVQGSNTKPDNNSAEHVHLERCDAQGGCGGVCSHCLCTAFFDDLC